MSVRSYCSTTESGPIDNCIVPNNDYREYTVPKIYWGLNWLSQKDPKLIRFIKEKLLIPPPCVKQRLKILEPFDEKKPWKHQGTHGEALAVETIYGLKTKTKMSGNDKIKQVHNIIVIYIYIYVVICLSITG